MRTSSSPAQYNILRILRGEGKPLPCLEIADRLVQVVPAITGLIDRLEQAEMVRRKRCETDRRVVYVEITNRALTGPILGRSLVVDQAKQSINWQVGAQLMTTPAHPNSIDPGVRIGHVQLKVANLERALQFNSEVHASDPGGLG